MSDNPNLSNQRFSGLPQFNAPLVDPKTGMISQAWQWAFTALWQKAGSTFSQVPTAAFPKQQPGLPITLHDAQTGHLIGQMITGTQIIMPPLDFTVVETFDPDGNPIFTIDWKDQPANEVFAGPASGADATPSFRLLVPDDLPIATTVDVGAVKPDGSTITILPDGTISSVASGGTPGGANGNVQYNNAGAFGGLTDVQLTTRIQQFTSLLSGAVGASGGGTVNFLRADGTWVSPPATSFANPSATAGPAAVNGVATTAMRSDAAPAVQLGTNAQKGIVQVDGTTITAAAGVISAVAPSVPVGANPTAVGSDVAVNGAAATFLRSDGAPAIQKGSNAQFGLVKGDGSSISISGGIASALAGGSIGPSFQPGHVPGRYYTIEYFGTALSTLTITANILYALPFYVPFTQTYVSMAINTGSAPAGKSAELGIYANDGVSGAPGQPGTKVLDAGTVSVAVLGLRTIVISKSLTAGWYWLVVASDGTPQLTAIGATQFLNAYYGASSAVSILNAVGNLTAPWTFSAGALPNSFPAITYGTSAASLPVVWIGP